jgi:hypothetical protein
LFCEDSLKFPSPEATSPLKPPTIGDAVLGNRQPHGYGNVKLKSGGDSGYNSTLGNNGNYTNHGEINGGAVEARLVPHSSAAPGKN